jgi:hypothetical protein
MIGTLNLQQFLTPGEREMGGIELSQGERTLLTAPLVELLRPGLGKLAAFREQVTELLIAYGELQDLDFLEQLPNITQARLLTPRLGDIAGLRFLHKLTNLSVERPNYRLDVLEELSELEELYLDDWRAGAASILRLSKLRKIGIQKYGYPTLEPAHAWTALQELWLNAGKLEDLRGIPPSLRKLRLTCQRKLNSLSALAACGNLEEVYLQSCRQVESLAGLEGCSRLRVLSLVQCGRIESLAPLEGLPIEFLALADETTVDEAETLYHLPRLKRLIVVRSAGVDEKRLLQAVPDCEIQITKR